LGQSSFGRIHGNSPYALLPSLLERLNQETPFVIVDFHAGATAEKKTLFAAADGHCSAVIGSHTRVQTTDETVLPGGTAVICDAGRTGSAESVGGTDVESRIKEYVSGIPDWTREAWARPELQGVFIELDPRGRALSIERIRMELPEMPRKDTEKTSEEGEDQDDPEQSGPEQDDGDRDRDRDENEQAAV
jgi:calcineurin-like phosphoesterase